MQYEKNDKERSCEHQLSIQQHPRDYEAHSRFSISIRGCAWVQVRHCQDVVRCIIIIITVCRHGVSVRVTGYRDLAHCIIIIIYYITAEVNTDNRSLSETAIQIMITAPILALPSTLHYHHYYCNFISFKLIVVE